MTQPVNPANRGGSERSHEIGEAIRAHVEALSYLPGSTAVAIKFIEIGKEAEAGPADYDKIVSSDASLGAKLLSLANSSWFATRHKVTTVLQAINMLGINNVRTLAISYCMAGMFNRLKLPREVVDEYWQASLCKAVAARVYAGAFDASLEDQAFMACLFQDMALPVMHSVAGAELTSILRDKSLDVVSQLSEEGARLGIDHAQVGRLLASKLELPGSYVNAVEHHHNADRLAETVHPKALAQAVRTASFFPHLPDLWHTSDMEALATFLVDTAAEKFDDRESFVGHVQSEFEALYRFFQPDGTPQLCLNDLIADACEELADATGTMMGQMNTLVVEAAQMGEAVTELAKRHDQLSDERHRDSLTETLNRAGFYSEAERCLEAASRNGLPFAMLYLDIDKFKTTNDTKGHQFGDYVLSDLCSRVRNHVRKKDVFGRLGGDEFAILLNDIEPDEVRKVVDAIMKAVRHGPYAKGRLSEEKSISLGVLCVPALARRHDIDTLINEADALMYMAKRAGAGQVRMRVLTGATVE